MSNGCVARCVLDSERARWMKPLRDLQNLAVLCLSLRHSTRFAQSRVAGSSRRRDRRPGANDFRARLAPSLSLLHFTRTLFHTLQQRFISHNHPASSPHTKNTSSHPPPTSPPWFTTLSSLARRPRTRRAPSWARSLRSALRSILCVQSSFFSRSAGPHADLLVSPAPRHPLASRLASSCRRSFSIDSSPRRLLAPRIALPPPWPRAPSSRTSTPRRRPGSNS